MSRIGRQPVTVPEGVKVDIADTEIIVEGPKGKIKSKYHHDMKMELSDSQVVVTRPSDEPAHRALHGLTRSIVANMIEGVTEGFSKALEIVGVGYRAEKSATGLTFNLGYSKSIEFPAPEGIEFTLESPTMVVVRGIDKQLVGQTAAEIRALRPPEPYKGKGIRYKGEYIKLKAGKTGVA